MISLARWLVLLLYRRFRWVAIGAMLRALTRRSRERSVSAATDDLARRLPESVVKVADSAPGDLLRYGGRVVATGRNARQVGRAGRTLGSTSKRLNLARRRAARGEWRSVVSAVRDDWTEETGMAEREFRSDFHRSMGDHQAADEALLDRRGRASTAEPLPEVPAPIPAGRPRTAARPRRLVHRVQRTYQRAHKPWDH